MKAINKSRTQVKVADNALAVSSKATMAVIAGASLLFGLWAVACFAGALVSTGPLGLLKAYFSAVTGM